jgi:hypothetical protein
VKGVPSIWLPLLLLVSWLSAACLQEAEVAHLPELDRAGVSAVLAAADAARVEAFAAADPAPLRPLFADPALGPLSHQLAGLRVHGERVEESDTSRRLVHWVAAEGSAEGVLEVAGEQRLRGKDEPAGGWSRIVRQWFAAVRWSGGRWLVVEARDLPPPQWWKA